MTLAGTVREAARRFGDTPALVAAAGWPLSYSDLDRVSDDVAAALAARGVRAGDVVALVLPSIPEYVVAYAAIAKLGAITTGVNPRFTAPERGAVLAVAQPTLVITTADLAPGIATGADDPFEVVVVRPARGAGELFGDLLTNWRPREAASTAGSPTGPTATYPSPTATEPDPTATILADGLALEDPDRVVAIVFTSGTTGLPKGAVFGVAELAAITASDVGDRWGGGGAMLASTAFAHIGFMTKLPWYLRLGTTTYLIDQWRAHDVLQLVHDHRMASIGGVAPQVALMLRDPDFDTFDFSCVQTLIMGGALSPPALVRAARERFGAAYSIRYSSTESGGIGTGTAFDADDDEALFTVGRPRGDVEIVIRDEAGKRCPTGEVGEVCLRSSAMMRGYWRDPEATAQTIRDGWIHTGDLGALDAQGCLRLAGRRKEMYIRGGYNVYPAEVEAVLASHDGVADVAVVPRADTVMGEIGVAVVVARDRDAPPTLDALRSFGASRLAAYKLPQALEVVDALPLTAMQKIDRQALRDQFGHPVRHTG